MVSTRMLSMTERRPRAPVLRWIALRAMVARRRRRRDRRPDQLFATGSRVGEQIETVTEFCGHLSLFLSAGQELVAAGCPLPRREVDRVGGCGLMLLASRRPLRQTRPFDPEDPMQKSDGKKKQKCKNCEGKGTLKKGDKVVRCQRCDGTGIKR
jgi:hypothetical protein